MPRRELTSRELMNVTTVGSSAPPSRAPIEATSADASLPSSIQGMALSAPVPSIYEGDQRRSSLVTPTAATSATRRANPPPPASLPARERPALDRPLPASLTSAPPSLFRQIFDHQEGINSLPAAAAAAAATTATISAAPSSRLAHTPTSQGATASPDRHLPLRDLWVSFILDFGCALCPVHTMPFYRLRSSVEDHIELWHPDAARLLNAGYGLPLQFIRFRPLPLTASPSPGELEWHRRYQENIAAVQEERAERMRTERDRPRFNLAEAMAERLRRQ